MLGRQVRFKLQYYKVSWISFTTQLLLHSNQCLLKGHYVMITQLNKFLAVMNDLSFQFICYRVYHNIVIFKKAGGRTPQFHLQSSFLDIMSR